LGIWASEREPKIRSGVKGNAQPLDRIELSMSLDCDVMLYLDADSTIHGDLTPMFEQADRLGYCATQWCDWVTNNGHTLNRLKGLFGVEGIPEDLVREVISHRWPSLNCGMYAARPSTPLLPQWYEWTKACGTMFICDERTQHLLMAKFPDQIGVMIGGAYNCSPKFQPSYLKDEDVVIRHYHGDSNVKVKGDGQYKSEKGVQLWWPIWQECLELNLGKIQGWWADCENKYLPTTTKRMGIL